VLAIIMSLLNQHEALASKREEFNGKQHDYDSRRATIHLGRRAEGLCIEQLASAHPPWIGMDEKGKGKVHYIPHMARASHDSIKKKIHARQQLHSFSFRNEYNI
jgi:hypothetical protein